MNVRVAAAVDDVAHVHNVDSNDRVVVVLVFQGDSDSNNERRRHTVQRGHFFVAEDFANYCRFLFRISFQFNRKPIVFFCNFLPYWR